MKTNLAIYNKRLVTERRSKKSIYNQKNLGMSQARYTPQGERKKERYKQAGQKMRNQYDKLRGFRNGRKKRRRR